MTESKQITTPYDDLTYKIIGCAMAVHRGLGPSQRENVYQRDLQVHFTQAGLSFEAQKLYEVHDSLGEGRLIGYYIPDFIVDEKVVVEIKALKGLDNSHLAQVIGYLAVSGLPVGLLINFGLRSLQYKRILPPKKTQEHLVNRQWLFIPDWLKSQSDADRE
jgi:GxxExxY protein